MIRDRSGSTLLSVVAAVVVATLALPTGSAEAAPRDPWSAWLGCWQLVGDGGEESTGERLVCFEPTETPLTVQMTTRVDDEVVLGQRIQADDTSRPVRQDGCEGTETATFSADGHRLLVRATHSCDGVPVQTSGVAFFTDSDAWVDVQVSEVEGAREVLVRRYRLSGDADAGGGRQAFASRVVRQAAAAPVDVDDVLEALEVVDSAAVEAMLLHAETGFWMDSDTLLRLARTDTPEPVVDLMIALSFPDYFSIDEGGEATPAPDRDAYGRYGHAGYGHVYVRGWGYGYPWAAYAYGDPFFAPFGYGTYYRPVRPILIQGSRFGGKVVRGRGYTRVQASRDLPSGGLGRLFSRGDRSDRGIGTDDSGSRSGSGTVTRSGHSRGKSSTGRKAKRRGGEGDPDGGDGGR